MNKKITPFHLFLLLFLFFSIPAFSGLSHNDTISPAASDSGHSIVSGIPVRPFGTTLFDFYTNVGPFSAETRVQELEKKMIKLAESPFFIADSLKIVHQGDFIHIMFGSEFLTVITRGDSVAENLSRETIAKTRFDKILFSIRDFRESHSKENAIKGILFSVITLFFLIVLVVLVNRLFRFFEQKIRIWQGTGRSVIRVLNYDLLNKNTQVLILLFLNKVFRIFTYFLSLILGLLLMFYLLPWTKNYSLEFLNFMLSPLKTLLGGFLNFLPNILIIFIILVVARFINRFFRFLKKEIEGEALKIPGFYPEYALPTFNLSLIHI